jgi:hypothetical protein
LEFGIWNLESGIWNPGTLELWNSGTLEPWNPGTLEPEQKMLKTGIDPINFVNCPVLLKN